MKKLTTVILFLFLSVPLVLNAQVFVDPNFAVPAQVLAYKMSQPPTIDGDTTDWNGIPWEGAYYNDRDDNFDNLMDPAPGPNDFSAKFKAAWVNGSNVLYLLLEFNDDQIFAGDSIDWYDCDGVEIRVDPLNSDASGEPSSSGTAFNIGFRNGVNTNSGIEGPLPQYKAVWKVNRNIFPIRSILEVAITLPSNATLVTNYDMGFWLYFNENDNNDNTPTEKNAAVCFFPQLWSATTGKKLNPDQEWTNIYYYADLVCVDQKVWNVASGGSIQAALDQANPGDIIKVAPGTYTTNLDIETPNVHLEGTLAPFDTTKIVPQDPTKPAITIAPSDAAYGVTIQNFAIEGPTNSTLNGTSGNGTVGISIGSATARILGNYFTNLDMPLYMHMGMDTLYASDGVIEGNTFYHFNSNHIGGANLVFRYNYLDDNVINYPVDAHQTIPSGVGMDIAYNTIRNTHGECAIGYGTTGGTYTIHNNYLFNDVHMDGDNGIENQETTPSTCYIYNNTVVDWKNAGIQCNGPSKYYLDNNIVAYCAYNEHGDYDLRNNADVNLDYSLSWGNGTNNNANFIDSAGAYPNWTLGSHNLVVDPKFVSATGNDYRIAQGSPAIDAGAKFPFGFHLFYEGNSTDIGAYETGVPGEHTSPTQALVGEWKFDDSTNVEKATIGNNLILMGNPGHTHYVSYIEGPAPGNGAVHVPRYSGFEVIPDLSANGGGNRVNRYTMIWDIRISIIEWHTFLATEDSIEQQDSDWFIHDRASRVGVGQYGYSTDTVSLYQWHRIGLVCNLGAPPSEPAIVCYMDGDTILAYHNYMIGDSLVSALDGRLSLSPKNGYNHFFISADNDGDDGDMDIAEFRLYNTNLTYSEMQTMGNVVTDVKDVKGEEPLKYTLYQNYPNPFNPTTTIRFSLRHSGHVLMKVYNILGQEVKTLVNEDLKAGLHNVEFDASRLSSGIYFYTIKAGNFVTTKKMVLLK